MWYSQKALCVCALHFLLASSEASQQLHHDVLAGCHKVKGCVTVLHNKALSRLSELDYIRDSLYIISISAD